MKGNNNLSMTFLSTPITETKFILQKNTHNLRNFKEISTENRKTVKYRIETRSNKNQNYLDQFFPIILNWKPLLNFKLRF